RQNCQRTHARDGRPVRHPLTPKRKSIHDAQLLPVACVRRTTHAHPIVAAASTVPAKPGQPACLGKASRRTKVRRSLLLAGTLCVLAAVASADQVTLKNGDRLTGTIISSDGKTMLIKTDLAGDVNVQWD